MLHRKLREMNHRLPLTAFTESGHLVPRPREAELHPRNSRRRDPRIPRLPTQLAFS